MAGDSESPEVLEWSVRLWKRQPEKLYGIALTALIAGLGGWLLFRNPILGLLGIAIILGSTNDFWLPVSYRLDQTGASLKCGMSATAIEWPAVKQMFEVPGGVKLSPLAKKNSRLEAFRGILLRFEDNKDEVMAFIDRSIPKEAPADV